MNTNTWEYRKGLFSNKNQNNEELSNRVEQFKRLKHGIVEFYGWEELSELEIETALAKQVLDSEAKYSYSLDEIILKKYAESYLQKLAYPVKQLCSLAPSKETLQDKQYLFELKKAINTANQQILIDALGHYFCTLEKDRLVNLLSGKATFISKTNPLYIISQKEDMFTKEIGEDSKINPKLVGPHYTPGYNYDPKKWEEYTKTCQDWIENAKLLENGVDKPIDGITSLSHNIEVYKAYAEGLKSEESLTISNPKKV